MASVITEIDGQQFNDADYGIMISNASNDVELIHTMKQLAQAGLQNDKLNFSGLMDIYLSESMSSIRRKIETYEEQSIQRQQQQQEQAIQAQREATQAKAESEQADREQKMQETMIDSETKITVAQISANSKEGDDGAEQARITIRKLQQDWENMNNKLKLERDKHNETVRHNKATEAISKRKSVQKTA